MKIDETRKLLIVLKEFMLLNLRLIVTHTKLNSIFRQTNF